MKNDFVLTEIRIGLTKDTKDQEGDVIAFNNENYFNIEINYNMSKEVEYKNICYVCNLILRQIKPGYSNRYKDILPVIQINLNNYDQFGKESFIYVSKLMEETYKIVRNDSIKIVDINLDLLSEMSYTKVVEEKKDSLEYLLYAFVCEDEESRKKLYKGDEIMAKVNEKLSTLDTSIDEYLYYDKEALVHEASREQGYSEGVKQGVEQEKKEIIKNMSNNGLTSDRIHELTNIPLNIVQKYTQEK